MSLIDIIEVEEGERIKFLRNYGYELGWNGESLPLTQDLGLTREEEDALFGGYLSGEDQKEFFSIPINAIHSTLRLFSIAGYGILSRYHRFKRQRLESQQT